MRVIGTAGHVDHGKSTLVEALTGTHPDRLKEEREREMTIDLGFAWLTLPDGEEVGIIDVPGHRDFIENMLAGVGGIDAALFVIAADEGVMPQTREHLAILDLLQIQGGIVVLTKVDLVDDSEWLDLVEEDVRRVMKDTVLGSAPILRVSARSRQGIPQLIQALSECLAGRPPKADIGRPRLPIDRIFSVAGFGTVVTGTLSDGYLHAGDELEILPSGLRTRVRGLQTHKKKEDVAIPGSRTAVNLGGVSVEQVRRGEVVTHPGDYAITTRLDAHFRLLPGTSMPLRHNTQVKFYIGAAEVLARLRLLGVETLNQGEEGWLQLELSEPVVAVRGDRYILRRPSPGETIGGGIVVDPRPRGRHKRFSPDILHGLEALAKGTPAEILLQATMTGAATPLKEILEHSNLDDTNKALAFWELLESNQIVLVEGEAQPASGVLPLNSLVASRGFWDQLTRRAIQEVEQYHANYPLRRGMQREELKSKLNISPRLSQAMIRKLVNSMELIENGAIISRAGHQVRFTTSQQKSVQNLMDKFASAPYAPPSMKEVQAEIGEDLYAALVDQGILIQVSLEVVFSRAGYDAMLQQFKNLVAQLGPVTAAQLRDHLGTSRRYVLAFLEHLDSAGITLREGDLRRLRK